jgi:hypothetical protein
MTISHSYLSLFVLLNDRAAWRTKLCSLTTRPVLPPRAPRAPPPTPHQLHWPTQLTSVARPTERERKMTEGWEKRRTWHLGGPSSTNRQPTDQACAASAHLHYRKTEYFRRLKELSSVFLKADGRNTISVTFSWSIFSMHDFSCTVDGS